MKNYSEMSDFEINCAVGTAISFADLLLAKNGQAEYCNSWADAGPIIESNFIDIKHYDESDFWGAYAMGESVFHDDKNPLRAAMIVFLMMRDAAA